MDTTSLPPDDRPPVAGPRRVNRGLLWASALAVVVLAIATIVAFAAGDGGSKAGDVQQIDPNGTLATNESDLNEGTDVSGQKLPAVSYKTFDGETVSLATNGKPMVLNFWAAYCGPCVTEMPAIEQTYLVNSDRVTFLGLDVAEQAQSGLDMIQRTGITYPTARDPRAEVFRAFGGMNLPRTVLIAADGTIVAVHNGDLTQAELQALIDENLGS
jgi:thiol-disulfide isomerase/thioredoxin